MWWMVAFFQFEVGVLWGVVGESGSRRVVAGRGFQVSRFAVLHSPVQFVCLGGGS